MIGASELYPCSRFDVV